MQRSQHTIRFEQLERRMLMSGNAINPQPYADEHIEHAAVVESAPHEASLTTESVWDDTDIVHAIGNGGSATLSNDPCSPVGRKMKELTGDLDDLQNQLPSG